jgi:hypothetical protein
MPIVAQGGTVTLRANVGHSNGNPADDPALTLTILDTPGDPVAGFPVAIPPIVRDDLGAYHYVWAVPALLPVGDYTATWDATVDSADAGGSEQVEVVTPGTIAVSFVSIAEVRALIRSRLSDVDLQTVIDREEAWLAEPGRVGPLTGERIDSFTPGLGDTPLYLRRRAESVVLTDDGRTMAASEFLFTPSTGMIRRIWTSDLATDPPWRQVYLGWQGTVTATYTPADEAAVKLAIIELVRLATGETGYDSETIGDYSYSRGASSGRLSRAGLARSILVKRPAYSMRLHSAMEPA